MRDGSDLVADQKPKPKKNARASTAKTATEDNTPSSATSTSNGKSKSASTANNGGKNGARRSPKAASKIANLLRRDIITGNLHAGDKLLPERVLQEQFEVSRPTLREAMRLLEAESLIKISRGQHGGARVQKLDISVTARQVGMYLQMEGTTMADVLRARAFIEAPAAGLIAESRPLSVIEELRRSVEVARQAYEASDPKGLAEAQAHFSDVLTDHAQNNTLTLFAKLLHDIVHRQMEDLTVRTHSREGVRKMQHLGIRGREKLIELIEQGEAEEAERFWRLHLEKTAKVVVTSYRAQMPIDVLKDDDYGED